MGRTCRLNLLQASDCAMSPPCQQLLLLLATAAYNCSLQLLLAIAACGCCLRLWALALYCPYFVFDHLVCRWRLTSRPFAVDDIAWQASWVLSTEQRILLSHERPICLHTQCSATSMSHSSHIQQLDCRLSGLGRSSLLAGGAG